MGLRSPRDTSAPKFRVIYGNHNKILTYKLAKDIADRALHVVGVRNTSSSSLIGDLLARSAEPRALVKSNFGTCRTTWLPSAVLKIKGESFEFSLSNIFGSSQRGTYAYDT